MTGFLKWMRRAWQRRAATRSERRLQRRVSELSNEIEWLRGEHASHVSALESSHDDDVDRLQTEIGQLREQVESEQVANRIKQLEINELTAVVMRNRARVHAENEQFAPKEPERNGFVNRIGT